MPYLISELGEELLLDVERFCAERIKKEAPVYDRSGEWPAELYEEAYALGYHTLEVPEEYGGMGEIPAVDRGAIMEAFGKADAGFAVTLAAGNLAMEPVLAAGTDEQKERMCALVLNQGVGAFCLTEPEAGSDISNIKTVAKKEDGYYTIYGRKCFVTNGAHAAFYCVAAKVVEADSDGEKAQEKTAPDGGSMAGEKSGSSKEQGSLSFFFVEAGTSGICVEKHEDKMGIRLSETCDVVFEECRVPSSCRIGNEGDGFSIAMRALNKGRIWMSCVAVGLAERALEEGVAYAARREQFGHSVLDNQAMQFKTADMEIQIETARQMCAHALTRMERGMPVAREAAIAKCYSADVAVHTALEAIQMMGGYGYSRDFPAEKLLRDAKIFQIFEGTNEIQRIFIGKNVIREKTGSGRRKP